jgi:hypothetical protein
VHNLNLDNGVQVCCVALAGKSCGPLKPCFNTRGTRTEPCRPRSATRKDTARAAAVGPQPASSRRDAEQPRACLGLTPMPPSFRSPVFPVHCTAPLSAALRVSNSGVRQRVVRAPVGDGACVLCCFVRGSEAPAETHFTSRPLPQPPTHVALPPAPTNSRRAPSLTHQLVMALLATCKCHASLSQCAGCRQLRHQLVALLRSPDMHCCSRRGKCDGGFTPENVQTK